MKQRLILPVSLATLLAAASSGHAEERCEALTGVRTPPGVIGLPTSGAEVLSASVQTSPANGAFCKVSGIIKPADPAAPPIRFQLNLPETWNGKALQIGGGGYDGVLIDGETSRFPAPDQASPLKQGYATFGSDSGHQAIPGADPAAFAANAEALGNFAGDQLKKTHDAAVALIRRRYGRAPRRMYFQGNSQGGHEGFIVVQRYPADYDGVIAIHPVYDFAALQVDGALVGQAVYRTPKGWISPAQAAAVHDRVMAACDGLDGLKDGVISNVRACRASFRIESLACGSGGAEGVCLTPPQLATLRTLDAEMPLGVTLAGGIDRFPRWPLLEGAASTGRFNAFGQSATPARPPTMKDSFLYFMGDQMVRRMVVNDPGYDTLRFVPAEHAAALKAVSQKIDASSDDLSAFVARGGKLLLMHGTVDMAVSPYNTIAYYERLKRRFGDDGVRRFARFYVAPGFGHGDGAFVVGWNSLKTLDDWVDGGIVPPAQVAFDTSPAGAGRSRPLCEYPSWPRYNGAGDPASAASFTCTGP